MLSTTTAEAKAALRRALSQLPPAGWEELTQAFLVLPEVAQADTILVFYGVGREPDTRPAIRALLERGKRVALPKCLPGRRMQARAVSGLDKLTPGPFRIPEPGEDCPVVDREEIGLILVPAVAYDRRGYRLGQGGGYYDRCLAGYQGRTVGLCRDVLLQDRLPAEPHDLGVEVVLTETRRFSAGQKSAGGAQGAPPVSGGLQGG